MAHKYQIKHIIIKTIEMIVMAAAFFLIMKAPVSNDLRLVLLVGAMAVFWVLVILIDKITKK